MKNLWSSPTIRCYLIISLIYRLGISILAAMYVTFLLERGLNLLQANMVNFVFFTTLLIFEVPTGTIADVVGRKKSIVIASLSVAAGMYAYGFCSTFAGFAISEALIALGGTLFSGAFGAWLHDRLEEEGRLPELRQVMSIASMAGQMMLMAASVLGAVTFQIHPVIPFFIGGIAMTGCAIYAFVAMKDGHYKARSLARSCTMLRLGVRYAWRHPAIRSLIWLGIIQTAGLQAVNMQWQPFFGPHLPSKAWLGGIVVVIAVSLFIGAWIARNQHINRSELLIVWSQGVISLGVLVAGVAGSVVVAGIAFVVHEIARGFYEPVKQSFLHTCIHSRRKRATILSCEALSRDLGGMIGLPVSGAIALHGSISLAWVISSVVLICGTIVVRGRLACP